MLAGLQSLLDYRQILSLTPNASICLSTGLDLHQLDFASLRVEFSDIADSEPFRYRIEC